MEIKENVLSYEEYCALRQSVGWLNFSEAQTRKALKNSLLILSAVENGQTVGMGRVIGDGMYFTVVDIVVHPLYQKNGIGSSIMDMILDYIGRKTPAGGRSSVQLIAEKGKEEFYLNRGFKLIPNEFCGSGMRRVIRR